MRFFVFGGSDLDDMSYKDLRVIHQEEKKNPGLTEISPDFYKKAREYLEKLKQILNNEEDEHKKKLVEDELKSATHILKKIYEIREKKIVLAALSKIRGGKPDVRLFLENEKRLFDEILRCLETYRKIMLEGKEEEQSLTEDQSREDEKIIALVKEDIPKFVGHDLKKYSLRRGDVISLPKELFDILGKKDVVERII